MDNNKIASELAGLAERIAQEEPTVWFDSGDRDWGQDGAVFDNWRDAEKGALELAKVWVEEPDDMRQVKDEAKQILRSLENLDWDDSDEIEIALSINKRVGGLNHKTVRLLRDKLVFMD